MPSHELPLDIPYAKLAEWLISRQKLSKDWHKKLQAIKAKAAEIANDLPPELALPGGESVEYAAVKHIRDTLAETAEKTFFGNLTGTAGLWDKVLRAYEKDNVFLGEAGQLLVRNVDFEIPYLKQQAAKEQQQLVDFERKHNEHLHSAVQAARQYQQECETMGIKGVAVKQELKALTKGLPSTLHQAAEQLQCAALGEACTHYAACVSATLSDTGVGSHNAAELLPAVHRLRQAHLEAQAPAPDQGTSSMSAQTREVPVRDTREDVADTAASTAGAERQEAAAGQEAHMSEADGGQISWDIDVSAAEETTQAVEGQANIDWDADPVADGGSSAQNIDWDIGVDENVGQEASDAAHAGGIIGEMVSDGEFRSSLVNEAHELMAFLQTRLSEAGSMQILGGGHSLLEPVSSATLKHWMQELKCAVDHMTSERTQQLLLFQTSERYLSRVAAALQHKAGQESKFRRQAQQVETRRQNIRSALAAGSSRLAFLLDKTRAVKELAEKTLSKQLDRTVLIVGEINNLLD